ncbi:DUF3622 domain-containing protein [uncultured Paraglaciecola sp.]|uniref:DUF3622 domain-containing protein n=1 Tax=uncultured Paraglaciecola sp. TaxID=1765024 RepID=UPI00263050EC|nr:DUF3622 domain-containing protein [uncultured Paraglaciecola sp.]
MTQSKKYDCQITKGNAGWTTKIIRQVSSKKTVVSKRQDGFSTESEAQEWGKEEMKGFLKNLNERNKRRSKPQE